MSAAAVVKTTPPPPPPPPIIILDDDEDDISVIYATCPAVSSRHRRTLSNTTGTSTNNPISVESYSYKQKTPTRKKIINPITIDLSATANDGVQILPAGGTHSKNSVTKTEYDQALTFTCEICVEPTPYAAAFFIMGGCTHSYCSNCMISYVASKLQDNITQIRCPARPCPGLIEHDHCRHLLPKEVFDRWGGRPLRSRLARLREILLSFQGLLGAVVS